METLAFKSDNELSSLLIIKGKILEVDKVITILHRMSEKHEEE